MAQDLPGIVCVASEVPFWWRHLVMLSSSVLQAEQTMGGGDRLGNISKFGELASVRKMLVGSICSHKADLQHPGAWRLVLPLSRQEDNIGIETVRLNVGDLCIKMLHQEEDGIMGLQISHISLQSSSY